MQRNAKKTFKFSDGTVIPAGAKVGTPVLIVQRDPNVYENPNEFNGFRFSLPKETGSEDRLPTKQSVVSTDVAFQLFGHGRHAW